LRTELERLETRTSAADFWNDPVSARATLQDLKRHKSWVEPLQDLDRRLTELGELEALAQAEGDAATLADLERDLAAAAAALAELEFRLMLGGEDDPRNAYLTIHPGAGGLESQDWAEMLLRMYTRYCERHGWQYEALDLQPGEGAGIKSATLKITGEYAFGRLKAENGVHRLIRISPFDANQRRHTSFASVDVDPEIEEDVEVEIRDSDLRVDTYRASGAGGQHVNKTSSAVRITHLPTKIVVQCQNERSQLRNREIAMRILRARLYQHFKQIEAARRAAREPEKKEIGFGSQIRTYTFQPYTLVKDHRTSIDTGDVQRVMDGDLDAFVEGYLKWANEVRQGPRPA
jgi:peptide chain release factor 2